MELCNWNEVYSCAYNSVSTYSKQCLECLCCNQSQARSSPKMYRMLFCSNRKNVYYLFIDKPIQTLWRNVWTFQKNVQKEGFGVRWIGAKQPSGQYTGESGWHSGHQSHFPPLGPGSGLHVGWVLSISNCLWGFFSGYSGFPPSVKFDFHAKIWAVKQLNISLWLGRMGNHFLRNWR